MSSRRDFIKASIAAATAAVVGIRPGRAEGQGATGQVTPVATSSGTRRLADSAGRAAGCWWERARAGWSR